MNIGRHNYEEFFLMYADNELCAADRKAVEVFVADNADLKSELDLILQTVFNADEIVFENKAALLKEEITPLQEQLLLYTDNELSATEKEKVQYLINSDAGAAKEWSLLQKTILQTDTAIVFADKQSLYRKEEGRVVRIGWWRAAAAAVLLGFGTWTTLTLIKPSQQTEEITVAGKGNTVKPAQQTNSNTITAPQQQQTPVIDNNNTATINTAQSPVIKTTTQKNNTPAVNSVKQNLPQDKNNNNAVAKDDKKPSNNLPKPLYNNFNKEERNKDLIADVPLKENATKNMQSGNANALAASSTKPNTEAVNGYALNTAYNPDNADENNDNKVLYMDEENVKRSKLGGFIRKVKRVVERNTNIKAGNGIKVAGFDIALNK